MESEADTALDFTRRFARALAHDANNLTGAILVLSELMQMADGQNATRISDLATKIRKACWQLQIRINQPLALDHLPWAVRSHVHVSRLQELAHDLVSSLMPKKVSVRIETSAPDLAVSGTELLLSIVLFNLLRNAAEALGEAGGQVRLCFAAHSGASDDIGEPLLRHGTFVDGQRYLRLSVQDSGAGFSAETAELSFIPFYTSDKTGKKLGLGLHFVDMLVTGLGGVIVIRRSARTCIDVFLPTGQIDESADEAESQTIPALRHIAVVTTDGGWASRFSALATSMGAVVSVFTDPADVVLHDAGENNYSSLVLVGEQALHNSLIEGAQNFRMPCLAVVDVNAAAVSAQVGDLRSINVLAPAESSIAEALHRLLTHGAMQ